MDLGEFGDLETVELEPQPLQVPLHRTWVPDIPHKDHKLVAPHAADDIPLPEVALQDRGGLTEDFIPDLVSPGVVDMLEVIQIQHQKSAVASPVRQPVGDGFPGTGLIHQAGERVALGAPEEGTPLQEAAPEQIPQQNCHSHQEGGGEDHLVLMDEAVILQRLVGGDDVAHHPAVSHPGRLVDQIAEITAAGEKRIAACSGLEIGPDLLHGVA